MYLKVLFTVIGLIVTITVVYVTDFSKKYPLPITNRISFDAKLKFIRENIDPDTIDTLIVGSSIGLNNIQGAYLEKVSSRCKKVLNLSVYEATALEAEQLLELLDAFPHLERIIYSAQYSDFPHLNVFKEYDAKFLIRYIRNELNPIEEEKVRLRACNNISFCMKRASEWNEKHMKKNKFEYLGFDTSGSVPLHIYGKDIVSHRWRLPQPGIMNPKSFEAVFRMAKQAEERNIKFYLAHQPYRQPLYDKYKKVRDAMAYFDKRIRDIFTQVQGNLIVLQNLQLNDDYFSDRTHLNDKGSILTAKAIGKFIDEEEK
jgi:hypothetical protein